MPSVDRFTVSPQEVRGKIETALDGAITIARTYGEQFEQAAKRYELDPLYLIAIAAVETSGLDKWISGPGTSAVGAAGIGQFMPSTWSEISAKVYGSALPQQDRFDPDKAIPVLARYVHDLLSLSWVDTLTEAAAAYNWGMGNVRKLKDGRLSAMPAETARYVPTVMGVYTDLETMAQGQHGSAGVGPRPESGGGGGGGVAILALLGLGAAAAILKRPR